MRNPKGSAADQWLCQAAAGRGSSITPRQLEGWRAAGLLPSNDQQWPGGGGSSSRADPAVVDIVVALGEHTRRGRPLTDTAMLLFVHRQPVPDALLREALVSSITSAEQQVVNAEVDDDQSLSREFVIADALGPQMATRQHPVASEIRRRLRESGARGAQARQLAGAVWTTIASCQLGGPGFVDDDSLNEVATACGIDVADESAVAAFRDVLEFVTLEEIAQLARTIAIADLSWCRDGLEALVIVSRLARSMPVDEAPEGIELLLGLPTELPDSAAGWAAWLLGFALASSDRQSTFTEDVGAAVTVVANLKAEFGEAIVETILRGDPNGSQAATARS